MIDYPALKAVHVTCVAASYVLFVVRGVWMIRDSAMLQRHEFSLQFAVGSMQYEVVANCQLPTNNCPGWR